MADKILVIYEGRIVGQVSPDRFDPEEVGLMMAGLTGNHGGPDGNF